MLPLFSQAGTFNLGTITQAEGEITFLNFAPPHQVKQVKVQEILQTDGSYLTQDTSFMTVELFDGSWLRVSPKSKFTLEYLASSKTILVHLFSGSVKILFSTHLNKNEAQKIIVKSADTLFESVEGKFTISRNIVSDISNVYVEKGTVIATKYVHNERKDSEIIHARETASIKDIDTNIESPSRMTDKEIKFLHPSSYLNRSGKMR